MNKVLVVGPGAIGQWLVALLHARARVPVTLLVRTRQKQALAAGIGWEGDRLPIEVVDELPAGSVFSDVIFATKAYAVGAAAQQLQDAGVAVERVWGFQNGVGSDPELAARFPGHWFGAFTTTVPVAITDRGPEPGRKGGLAWATPSDPSRAPTWLDSLGLPCVHVPRVDSLKWSKLLLNVTCNASCALLNCSPAEIVAHRPMFAFELTCLREMLRALRRARVPLVDLPGYSVTTMARMAPLPDELLRSILGGKIRKARGSKPPSLLLDLRAGRRDSEVDVLNGAIVRLGREAGVPTPGNLWLWSTLRQVLDHPEEWPRWKGRRNMAARQALAAVRTNSGT